MTPPAQPKNPNELLLITREELERCCSQMSAAGYKVSANYVEASVLSRSRRAPLTQNDGGNCLVICQHCGKVTQVQCNDSPASPDELLDDICKICGAEEYGACVGEDCPVGAYRQSQQQKQEKQ